MMIMDTPLPIPFMEIRSPIQSSAEDKFSQRYSGHLFIGHYGSTVTDCTFLLCRRLRCSGNAVNNGNACGNTAMKAKPIAPKTVIRFNTFVIYSFVSVPGRIPGIYVPDLPRFSAISIYKQYRTNA